MKSLVLMRATDSAFSGGRLALFNGCSVHLSPYDGSITHLYVGGAERLHKVPEATLQKLEDYSWQAVAYYDLTGSGEGFPEQEFDL